MLALAQATTHFLFFFFPSRTHVVGLLLMKLSEDKLWVLKQHPPIHHQELASSYHLPFGNHRPIGPPFVKASTTDVASHLYPTGVLFRLTGALNRRLNWAWLAEAGSIIVHLPWLRVAEKQLPLRSASLPYHLAAYIREQQP
jgi:hypothetical protein